MNPAAVRLQSLQGYLISVREPYSARAEEGSISEKLLPTERELESTRAADRPSNAIVRAARAAAEQDVHRSTRNLDHPKIDPRQSLTRYNTLVRDVSGAV